MKYLVVYEKGPTNYAASVPDVQGCVALGATLEETRDLLLEGLHLHFIGILEDGEEILEPTNTLVDFAGEVPENGVEYCVVEWLEVELPVTKESHPVLAADERR